MKKILFLILTLPIFCFSQNNHDDKHSHDEHSH